MRADPALMIQQHRRFNMADTCRSAT